MRGWRGSSAGLLDLGLYPTGVKKGPTVNKKAYFYVNVGSVVIDLQVKIGLAATEVITMWRSGGSSLREGKPLTRPSTTVIV